METTVAVVDDHMEGDTASELSQETEDTPPSDIIMSSKLKLINDLEKSLKFTWQMGVPCGMVGADFQLRFWCYDKDGFPPIRCHRFMLAARSEVFHDMFMETPLLDAWKIEIDEEGAKVAEENMMKYIYTGTIGDVPPDTVSGHLNLTSTFKLEPMGELVQKKLIDSLDPTNCIKYLITASTDPLLLGLREKAIKTIVDNLSHLVSLEEWEDLNKSHPSLTTEISRTYFMR